MTKPIKPSDIVPYTIIDTIPNDIVIEIINRWLNNLFSQPDNTSIVMYKVAILYAAKEVVKTDYSPNILHHNPIIEWAEIESLYREAGWNITVMTPTDFFADIYWIFSKGEKQ